jgi:hypothetical protein
MAGDLFIMEQDYSSDSDSSEYRIRKVPPDGIISTLASLPDCCYGAMATDAAGNLFVPVGSTVWKISPSGNRTMVVGNGTYGRPAGDGGPATQAQLNGPTAVSTGPAGDLFIADNIGCSIRRVTSDGIIRTFASIDTSLPGSVLPASGDGGPAVSAQLRLAVQAMSIQSGLAADSAGNLYIAETGAHRVRKVSPSGTISTVAGISQGRCSNPSNCLPLGDGGAATSAALTYPTSVAVDGAGNLFIADSGNLRVRKVSPDGMITTVAGNGNPTVWPGGAGDGGPAINTPVVPYGVAVDNTGNLFIWEGNLADVRKVSRDGIIRTVLSPNRTLPYFGYTQAATVDREGNLFVAGSDCEDGLTCYNAIEKISPSGDVTVVADGRNASLTQPGGGIGDGGPALKAQLGFVSSLAVDSAGNLFLADLLGQRIRKIDSNGIINTVGGDGFAGYSGDGGPATKATINYPFSLATDTVGNVYVSDFNQAVRILRPTQSKWCLDQ